MLEVCPDLLAQARALSGLSCKDSAALLYAAPRNWYAWEEGKARMMPALFELFLIKTAQKELKSIKRAAGKLEQRDTPPGASVIKLGRNAAELTQAQAAQLVHVTPSAWQNWELGKTKMHPGVFELFMLKTGWTLSEPEPVPEKKASLQQIDEAQAELDAILAAYPQDIVIAAQQLREQHKDMSEFDFWFMRCGDHTVSKEAWHYAGDRMWHAAGWTHN